MLCFLIATVMESREAHSADVVQKEIFCTRKHSEHSVIFFLTLSHSFSTLFFGPLVLTCGSRSAIALTSIPPTAWLRGLCAPRLTIVLLAAHIFALVFPFLVNLLFLEAELFKVALGGRRFYFFVRCVLSTYQLCYEAKM